MCGGRCRSCRSRSPDTATTSAAAIGHWPRGWPRLQTDPDLARILDAWPTLPPPICRSLLALVELPREAVPVQLPLVHDAHGEPAEPGFAQWMDEQNELN